MSPPCYTCHIFIPKWGGALHTQKCGKYVIMQLYSLCLQSFDILQL